MTDEIPTLDELIASGAMIERHPKHPLWWRATQADGSVVTCRESVWSSNGAPVSHCCTVWHGYAECWCLNDAPHEPDCEQGLYETQYEFDRRQEYPE